MALEKITSVSGKGVYVPGSDIDTDRIIPARFMKCVTFDGLGEYLFYDVRHEEDGTLKPHPLNEERFAGASILISGINFGCGSSREHAPQAISKGGFRAVIAQSFAEIFFGNCATLGMPCVIATAADIEKTCRGCQCRSRDGNRDRCRRAAGHLRRAVHPRDDPEHGARCLPLGPVGSHR